MNSENDGTSYRWLRARRIHGDFLRAAQKDNGKITRRGRKWRAGSLTLDKGSASELINRGLIELSKKRLGWLVLPDIYRITDAGRMVIGAYEFPRLDLKLPQLKELTDLVLSVDLQKRSSRAALAKIRDEAERHLSINWRTEYLRDEGAAMSLIPPGWKRVKIVEAEPGKYDGSLIRERDNLTVRLQGRSLPTLTTALALNARWHDGIQKESEEFNTRPNRRSEIRI